MQQVDVVVIGAGVMGAAAARSLSRRGREVLLLEQFDLGHKRGSSHGASRIFRLSYNDAMYVRMAQQALPLWRELEDETGEAILTRTGGLDLGHTLGAHASALRACGVHFELVDGASVASRFPFLRLEEGERALFQPDSGILAADSAVRALATSAVRRGVELREHTKALGLAALDGSAEIATEAETYRARAVVVTAGAWARGLLFGAGIDLPTVPSRETVSYFRIEGEALVPTLVDWGSPSVYSLPSPGEGIKAGEHHAGPATDPDERGRVNEHSIARLCEWVIRRYRGADPSPHRSETCLYTNTADEHFILSGHGPIVVGSPCSGHGFKFAPVIGERLADLVASSQTGARNAPSSPG